MTVLDYLIETGKKVSAPCGGNGTCKGCLIDAKMPSGEVKRLLACQTEYIEGMEIILPENDLEILGANKIAGTFGASNFVAVDIGTTTVAMALVDGKTGEIISETGFSNSQRVYGADVISRIAASNSGKKDELQKLIIRDIKKGLDKLGDSYERIVISANTTMMHLFLGLSCEKLGTFPFTPETLSPEDTVISELSDKPISFVPGISAFVGGDIVSGILSLPTDGYSMLVDLGTNGEMVLWNEDNYFVTSTSAGPAFEESRLSYGSDSISKLASYLQNGIINECGLIEDEEASDISGEDVAKLQLAKSAIRTGIDLLLERTNTYPDEVKHLYIAGGFGKNLDIMDAVTIGLIPSEMSGVSIAIGNSSLDGAIRFGLRNESREDTAKIIKKAIKVDLANDPKFNDLFSSNMMF